MDTPEQNQRYAVYSIRNTVENGLIYGGRSEQLKLRYSLNALPKVSALSKEYEELSKRRDELYEERSLIRKEYKDLENARYNLCTVLGKEKDLELHR